MQGRRERRGILSRHPVGGDPARCPCATGGQERRGRFWAGPVRHRWAGDLSRAASHRARSGGRHHHRIGQLHDGDAEAPQPQLAGSGGHGQYRRGRPAGRQRSPGRRVHVCGGLARDAQPSRHLSELAGHPRPGPGPVHRAVRVRWAWTGHGGRVHALAGTARPEPGEDGHPRRDPAPPRPEEPPRLLLRNASHSRGLPQLPDGGLSVLPLRLRHSRAGSRCHCPDHGRSRARFEAAARLPCGVRSTTRLRGGRAHREPERLHGGRA